MIRVETLSNELPDDIKQQDIKGEFCKIDSEIFKKLSNSVDCIWNIGSTDTNEFLMNAILFSSKKSKLYFEESFLVDLIMPLNGIGYIKSSLSSRVYTKVYRVNVAKGDEKDFIFVGFYWYEAGCYSNGGTIDDQHRKMFKNAKVIDQFPDDFEELVKELKNL